MAGGGTEDCAPGGSGVAVGTRWLCWLTPAVAVGAVVGVGSEMGLCTGAVGSVALGWGIHEEHMQSKQFDGPHPWGWVLYGEGDEFHQVYYGSVHGECYSHLGRVRSGVWTVEGVVCAAEPAFVELHVTVSPQALGGFSDPHQGGRVVLEVL